MNGLNFIEDLSAKIKLLAQDSPRGDLEKNLHALLQSTFSKLALVSREEFDVQSEILRQTRLKLDALQKLVDELEKNKRRLSD
ncbi:MAG: accessory factor UbiK family protein [Methylophilaceae bacterium]|nr:accessory factor UbiK family protein [Methylophilaceae bacterium]